MSETQRGSPFTIMAIFTRIFFLTTLICTSFACSAAMSLQPGSKAPDWILPNQNGKHISYYKDSGSKTTVILFWATWCPYCQALMPELEKLRQETRHRPIKFYALNIWENGDPVNYMNEHNYGFSLLLGADNVARRYGVMGTPGLFVISPNKIIRYVRSKGSSAEEVAIKIRQVLSGETPTETPTK